MQGMELLTLVSADLGAADRPELVAAEHHRG